MTPMRSTPIPHATLLLLLLAAACTGERGGGRVDMSMDEGLVPDSTFADFAARQLGRLRAGTTLEQWAAASPGDTVVLAQEAGARADTAAAGGFCARSTLRQDLPGGGTLVRHAYFYPPSPDPSAPLPSPGDRARLLRTACTVGVIAAHEERGGARVADTTAWLPAFAPGAAPALAVTAASGPASAAGDAARALRPGLACSSDAAGFHAAVQAAEDRVWSTRDPALAARLHLALADTYADLIALSYGPAGTTDDLDVPEPSGLRTRAAEHYRLALALEPGMPEARRAWGTAWRLLAGLVPEGRGC